MSDWDSESRGGGGSAAGRFRRDSASSGGGGYNSGDGRRAGGSIGGEKHDLSRGSAGSGGSGRGSTGGFGGGRGGGGAGRGGFGGGDRGDRGDRGGRGGGLSRGGGFGDRGDKPSFSRGSGDRDHGGSSGGGDGDRRNSGGRNSFGGSSSGGSDRGGRSDRGGGGSGFGARRNDGDRGGSGGRGGGFGSGGGGNRFSDRNERGGDRNDRGGDRERRPGGGGSWENRNGGSGGGRFDKDKREGGAGGSSTFNNNKGENAADEKPREFYIPPEPTDNEEEIFSSGISSGINFAKYDHIPVKVSGDNAPRTIQTFAEANLRDLLMDNVRKSGYKVPTPIQKAALPIILGGRDLMACAQTGSGKTAAFLLPILNRLIIDNRELSIGKPQALIVTPTRELTVQIFNEARKFALGSAVRVNVVYGGTSSKYQGENISKGCHLLICTPGRLLDFVEKCFITFEETRFVVLDEADRMLDMGFKEIVNKIMNHSTMRPIDKRQNLMFSATFPEDIQRMAGEFLNKYVFVTVGVVGGACSDVTQTILEVRRHDKRSKLMELLNEGADGTIVFVETKRGADFLASMLSETEFPTTSIHGDRLQRQREQALTEFKSGRMKILIATSVAARGLDIKKVAHVINYDLPQNIDDYVHRIGRTGRVGNNGKATSFFDPECDGQIARDLVKILEGANQKVPQFLTRHGGGGHGGSDRGGYSKFGGRDVRDRDRDRGDYKSRNDDHYGVSNGPKPLEDEEEWY